MTVLTLEQAAPRLRQAYRDRRLIPFLGAGFSKPLKLPTWGELTEWMAKPLGFDPDLFTLHGDARELAGYFDLAHPERLPWFIDQMKQKFHADEAEDLRKRSAQHQALAECKLVRTIYTTNFEHHIERGLEENGRKAEVLVRLEDYMRPVDPEACQVVKFHGDLEHPETVVLTESQFFERFRLEAAPDQRLRSDLLSNVFLFLGYSFSDPNIRYIWWRMDRLRREGQPSGSRVAPEQRCYFATFGAGFVQPVLLDAWHVDVILLDPADPSRSVVDLLQTLTREGGAP